MQIIKKITLFSVAVFSVCALAGCMNVGNPSTSATPRADADWNAPNTAQAPTLAPYDWQTRTPEVEGSITRLSEIASARVLTDGNTALVGITFDSEYKGDMTQRIREMVASEILKADANIETVAVTAEPSDVQEISAMADRVAGGESIDTMRDDMLKIVRNATTLR